MSSSVLLKANGLVTSPNRLNTKEGALLTAKNVVTRRDNVIEPRRGSRLYGDSFGSVSDRAKQIIDYKQRVLRHYSNVIEFDTQELNNDSQSIFSAFSGEYTEPESGIKIKSLEQNSNLYFTSSDGIKKISASSPSDLSVSSGYITNAGGLKALDLQARLNITDGSFSGFLPQDSAVAYRVVWGLIDVNNNLILGEPSQRFEIYNSLLSLMLSDFARLLGALDDVSAQTGSTVNDANYISTLLLAETASATSLRTNLISLAQKIDKERGELFTTAQVSSASITSNVCTVTVAANIAIFGKIAVGDKIYLTGTWTGAGSEDISGLRTISAITATTFTFSVTATNGAVTLSGEAVESGWFRSITQPGVPSTSPTNAQLVAIQDYLDSIIIELQGSRNVVEVAENDGVATQQPLEITTAAVTGTTTLTINFDTTPPADARDQFLVGDYIFLDGTWTGAGAENLSGLYTVVTVAAGNITVTVPVTTNGAVTLSTTSTIDRILRFTNSTQSTYITPLAITSTSSVYLDITIPPDTTLNHFYQIYRSPLAEATGTTVLSDLVPSDELYQVFENFPTQTELDSGSITVEDVTLDTFRGAPLYTNPVTGEGILQANGIPPLSKDIAAFKNFTFYANTQTRHKLNLALLGVSNLISEYNAGRIPKLVISTDSGEDSHTYDFVTGIKEITNFNTVAGGSLASSGTASYFYINNANDFIQYYVWYAIGTATDPAISGKNGLKVLANTGDTSAQIASKTQDVLNRQINDFTVTVSSNTVTVTNVDVGYTTDASAQTSGFTAFSFTQGRGERSQEEMTSATFPAATAFPAVGAGSYFTLNKAYDRSRYYIWFNRDGGNTDPAVANKTGIQVLIVSADTASGVATKAKAAIEAATSDFSISISTATLTISNVMFGPVTDATSGTMPGGFTLSITQQGALEILLSDSDSVGQAVDDTARSLVRVVNKSVSEVVSAFYLSGSQDVPGKFLLEAKDLSTTTVYVLTNKSTVAGTEIGDSFNPVLTPTNLITAISIANPTSIISGASHGLINGDQVMISNSNSTPNIDGVYTVTVTGVNTFTIAVQVISAGTTGSWTALDDALNIVKSDNEVKANRIYYSKVSQPEAVPILNYLDVGSRDSEILRIFALRDSLMIFKEDGLYRLSGETTPFTVSLFDVGLKLIAADSLDEVNNTLFGWTTQGIQAVTESGATIVSRDIDVDILPKAQFSGFSTNTWGIGYDSDNAYYVWTLEENGDTVPTIGYVYNTLTNSWSTYNKSKTCGIINSSDDKLYLGAGDTNFIEQERRDFSRTDYADRETVTSLDANKYVNAGQGIILSSVSDIKEGDVLAQVQLLTIYEFNALLKKLDIDPGVTDTNYFSLLQAAGGNSLRDKLANASASLGLAAKLDADAGVASTDYLSSIASQSGTITAISVANPTVITTSAPHGLQTGRMVSISGSNSTPSIDGFRQVTVLTLSTFSIDKNVTVAGTTGSFSTIDTNFEDIKACYNTIITKLNADTGVGFNNYTQVNTETIQEAVITAINQNSNTVTLNLVLPYVIGEIIIYEAIETEVLYAPQHFGDPLSYKQIREATLMFEAQRFTSASISFSSDLIPEFTTVEFTGMGNGIFGHQDFGENFFGGVGNSQPLRTYVTRNHQRCRYLNVQFNHTIARENYYLYGCTLTGNLQLSERAYR